MLQLFSPFMLNEASSVNGGTDRFTKEYLISEPVFTALYFLLINMLKSRQYESFKVIAPLLDGIKCTYSDNRLCNRALNTLVRSAPTNSSCSTRRFVFACCLHSKLFASMRGVGQEQNCHEKVCGVFLGWFCRAGEVDESATEDQAACDAWRVRDYGHVHWIRVGVLIIIDA